MQVINKNNPKQTIYISVKFARSHVVSFGLVRLEKIVNTVIVVKKVQGAVGNSTQKQKKNDTYHTKLSIIVTSIE